MKSKVRAAVMYVTPMLVMLPHSDDGAMETTKSREVGPAS